MRMNSRFLSGFLLSVILAAGMNCRALADSAENNASASVYTEQAEQADLGEGDNNASPDVSQDASDHSEDVSGEDSQEDNGGVADSAAVSAAEAAKEADTDGQDTNGQDAAEDIEEESTTEIAGEDSEKNNIDAAETPSANDELGGLQPAVLPETVNAAAPETRDIAQPSYNAIVSDNTVSAAEKGVSIDGVEVEDGQEAADGSWRYLGDSGRLVMIDHDGSDESFAVAEGGVTVLAAGINKIGKLLCNGNVAILGTGIMMVDEVEMGADSTLSLQTNTDIYEDGTGSVAFFLKTGEEEYTLANGDIGVTGILDEQYTVKGVKLIVPSQSKLLLNSVGSALNPSTGEVTYYFGGIFEDGA